jgi:hypothetical protein
VERAAVVRVVEDESVVERRVPPGEAVGAERPAVVRRFGLEEEVVGVVALRA